MDIHVVKSGDTLYSIALQHGVPMSQLILDNQLPEPDRLVVGQAIVIQYPEQTYTVQAGDTLFSIAAAHRLLCASCCAITRRWAAGTGSSPVRS